MTCWIQDNFYFNLPILHLYTLHSAVAIHPSLYSLCRKGLCLVILSLHLFSFFCADFSQVGWLAQICFISSGPSVRPSLWREERRGEERKKKFLHLSSIPHKIVVIFESDLNFEKQTLSLVICSFLSS